ncbi:DUF2663 family protein [Salirhabdus sp. Marseille-P4669]|uniref:DUF2663 family protein n=1 Tax=Salirhabdus sp. Marseille-P4669 TaxID=2042310 RepID=UPI000C7C4B35|nr:DUF2663 family protein [Salirhabdus sp. Marseille-P4669]
MVRELIWEKENFFQNDKNAIYELIKRKRKLTKHEQKRDYSLRIFSIGGGFSIIAILSLLSFDKRFSDMWAFIDVTLGNIYFIVLVVLLSYFYSSWLTHKKKAKEEKEKYHALRKELAEKSSNQWLKMYEQTTILHIVQQLKDEYDIEISYKG